MNDKNRRPENVGAINPFALAEVKLKRRVNWKRVANPRKLLEQTLGKSYGELFDPKHDSPVFAGLKLDTGKRAMVKVGGPSVEVGSVNWIDPGDFYEEASEFSDPVQGALGDCYFISALASVAWARPYVIAQRTRATGTGQQQFVDMIEFFDAGKSVKVEVSELLPLNPPANGFIYARSAETGEIWPAVYEKAYAKWRTGAGGDQPDYAPIAGGDPVAACSQLTNLPGTYLWTSGLSADECWNKVRGQSVSYKTFNPMVAWTYPSGDASPDKVNYDNAHLVANHAYSVLGWQLANSQKYIILRNPWGSYEATLHVDGGTWIAWDQPYYGGKGWWRPIAMGSVDGVFALRADTFKQFFAGFGYVKTPEAP